MRVAVRTSRDERRGGRALAGARIAIYGFTALAMVVMARTLETKEFGVLAGAMAVSAVVGLFGYFGIDQLYIRGDLDDDALATRTLELAGLAFVANAVAALAWPGLSTDGRLCIIVLGLVSVGEQLKLPWIFAPTKALDFGTRARRELVGRVAPIFGFVVAGVGFRSALGAAVGTLVGTVVVLPVAARWMTRLRVQELRFATLHYRRGLPFALSAALYTTYFQVDMALTASFRPVRDVAEYRVAYSFLLAAIILPVVINNDLLRSRLFRLRAGDSSTMAQARVLTHRALAATAIAAVACTLVLLFAAGPLVSVVYGPGYGAAVGLVEILALACIPHFLNSWSGNLLVARGLTRAVVGVQALLLVGNVAANLVVIPTWGPTGAAVVTLATEMAGVLLYGVVLWRAVGTPAR